MVYFKNQVNAEGFQTNFYSSPGYPTHASDQKPWVMYDPGERAEQIWANSLWWKQNYGIDINYDVIYNEPSSPITSSVLADDIMALAPRMAAHRISYKDAICRNALRRKTDWGYRITPEQSDAALWPLVGRISLSQLWHCRSLPLLSSSICRFAGHYDRSNRNGQSYHRRYFQRSPTAWRHFVLGSGL